MNLQQAKQLIGQQVVIGHVDWARYGIAEVVSVSPSRDKVGRPRVWGQSTPTMVSGVRVQIVEIFPPRTGALRRLAGSGWVVTPDRPQVGQEVVVPARWVIMTKDAFDAETRAKARLAEENRRANERKDSVMARATALLGREVVPALQCHQVRIHVEALEVLVGLAEVAVRTAQRASGVRVGVGSEAEGS